MYIIQKFHKLINISFALIILLNIFYILYFLYYGYGTLVIGDAGFPYNKNDAYYRILDILSSWYDREFFGRQNINYHGIGGLFYILPIYILYSVINAEVVQFLWVFLILTIAIGSFYILLRNLTSANYFICFILSIAFAFNPWAIDRLIGGHFHIYQAAAFIPLVLYFFIKWQKNHQLIYIIGFWFTSLFVLQTMHYTFMVAVLVFVLICYEWVNNGRISIAKYFKFLLVVLPLYSFYAFPLFLAGASNESLTILDHFKYAPYVYGKNQTFFNTLGFDGFHVSLYKEFELFSYLRNAIFFILLFLGFVYYTSNKKRNKNNKKSCFLYW